MTTTISPLLANIPSITMIGCGNMGGAMLHQWLKNERVKHAHIIKPSPLKQEITQYPQVKYDAQINRVIESTDFTILAVKPQILKEIARNIAPFIPRETAIISIAAGLSLETLQCMFPEHNAMIRTMPNTPCAVGKGVSASFASQGCSDEQKNTAHDLLNACSAHYWLESENQIDMITALSGSGPAYVYYFIESLEKAAITIGLDEDKAKSIARQMVIGAAALAEQDTQIDVRTLRQNVTSKGGTTQAALEQIMDGRLDQVLVDALRAAQIRAQELNS